MIITLNSIPYIALAPVLIIWFGIGIAPKVALVAVVAFFLIFFSTFSGARTVDREWIDMLDVMGASRRERFQKVIAPASIAWILSGVKAALPYSLIAATVGEMMFARAGVGNYITASAAQFDITGIYTGLFVLMFLGAIFNGLARRVEGLMLRWRPGST
jgi:NitT/TauT family transport system permease protein